MQHTNKHTFRAVVLLCLLAAVMSLFPLAVSAGEAETAPLMEYTGFSSKFAGDHVGIRSLYNVNMTRVKELTEGGTRVAFGAVLGIGEYEGTEFTPRTTESLTVEKKEDGSFATVSSASLVLVYDSAVAENDGFVGKTISNNGEACKFAYTMLYEEEHAQIFSTVGLIGRGFLYTESATGEGSFTYVDAVGETFNGENAPYGTTTSVMEIYDYFTNVYVTNEGTENEARPYYANQKCIGVLHAAGTCINRENKENSVKEPTATEDGYIFHGCEYLGCADNAPVVLNKRGTLDTTPIVVDQTASFTPDSVNGLIEIAVNNVAKAGWYRVLPFGDAKLEDSTNDATFMYNKTLQGLGLASAQAHKVDNANTTAALERPYYVYLAEGNNVVIYKRGTPALATVPALPTLTKVTFTMVATEDIDVGLVLGDALSGQFTGSLNNTTYIKNNPSVVNGHHWFKMTDKAITYENVTIAESGYYYVLGMMRSGGVNTGYTNEFRIDFTKTGEDTPYTSLGGDVLEAQDAVTPSETTNGSYNGRKLAEMGRIYLEAGTYTIAFLNASHADSNAKIIIGGLFLSLNTHVHAFTSVAKIPATCDASGVAAHKVCHECGLLFNAAGTETVTEERLTIPATGKHDYVDTFTPPTDNETGIVGCLCTGCQAPKPGTTAVTLKARGTLDTTPIVVDQAASFTPDSVNGLIEIAVNNVAKAGWYRVLPFGDPSLSGNTTNDATFMYNKTLQGLGMTSAQAHTRDNVNTISAYERPYYVYLAEGNNVIVYKRGTPSLTTVPTLPTLTKVSFTQVATEDIDIAMVLDHALAGQFTGSGKAGNPDVACDHWFKTTSGKKTYNNVVVPTSGYYYMFGMLKNTGGEDPEHGGNAATAFRVDFTSDGFSTYLTGGVTEALDRIGVVGENIQGSNNGRKLAEMGLIYLEKGTYKIEFSNASVENTAGETKITIGGLFLSLNTEVCLHTSRSEVEETPATCDANGMAKHTVCDDCGQLFNAAGTEAVTEESLVIPATGVHEYVDTFKEPTDNETGIVGCLCTGCQAPKPGTTAVTLNARGALDTTPIVVDRAASFANNKTAFVEISVNAVKAGWYRVLLTGDDQRSAADPDNQGAGTGDAAFVYNKAYQGLGLTSAQQRASNGTHPFYVYLAEGDNTVVYQRGTSKTLPAEEDLSELTKATFTQVATEGIDIAMVMERKPADTETYLDAFKDYVLPGQFSTNTGLAGQACVVAGNHYIGGGGSVSFNNVTVEVSGYYYVFGMVQRRAHSFSVSFTNKTTGEVTSFENEMTTAMDAIGEPNEAQNGSLNSRKLAEMGYVYLEAGAYKVDFKSLASDNTNRLFFGGMFLSLNTACTIASEE